jgi:hypothetical protein
MNRQDKPFSEDYARMAELIIGITLIIGGSIGAYLFIKDNINPIS